MRLHAKFVSKLVVVRLDAAKTHVTDTLVEVQDAESNHSDLNSSKVCRLHMCLTRFLAFVAIVLLTLISKY